MREVSHSQFLSFLRQRSIEVTVRDGRLQVSAPPGAVDPECRAELARRKPELLKLLQNVETAAAPFPLLPMKRTGRIPQTHAQQGLWLIDHFAPGNVAYNIPEAFAIEGSVEPEALQKAVDGLLARHETLRTFFYEDEGELLQAISAEVIAPVDFTDLSKIAESDRDHELQNLMREQARQPFDLSQAPMVRFHFFRLSEQRHVVFFNIHHIIADRRSLGILKEELILLYKAAVLNQPAGLPNLPVQYADYAIWAAKYLSTTGIAGQIEYWKQKLSDVPPFIEMPLSHPYPEQRTAWGATAAILVPSPLRGMLSALASQEGATMFMTLLAAFAVLLYKQSGQEDFCIGSPFTHRNHVETEPIIGLFVNMLVFRCQLTGDSNFREFLRQVRATALDAYQHSNVPFQELVRTLKPDLRSRRSPFFQVMFGYDPITRPAHDGVMQIDTHPGTARFDLTLYLRENPNNIAGSFEYCTDLFDPASIERMVTQFMKLLHAIASDPDQPISSIELMSTTQSATVILPDTPPAHPGSWSGRLKTFSQRFSQRLGTS